MTDGVLGARAGDTVKAASHNYSQASFASAQPVRPGTRSGVQAVALANPAGVEAGLCSGAPFPERFQRRFGAIAIPGPAGAAPPGLRRRACDLSSRAGGSNDCCL